MFKKLLGLTLLIAVSVILFSSPVMAQTKPIQLSLFAPIQIFSEDTAISGIRLSLLYGKNTSVTGLDWGLVNHTTSGVSKGVQLGAVGLADGDFVGWQHNWVNVVKGDFEGLQWGVVNHSKYVHGIQIGFVNYAGSMKGLQIGLVNIISQGGQFPVFPIVNWTF
jgi:hypothetical protein